MAASSRSKFYVDTPLGRDPPSQRHSMFVDNSEVGPKQDLSSASSSATLPSTAGSVDRLTGLGEKKKTPRFFTLKPKTSFSLRPFFSSTSISSLSPSSSKRHRKSAETTSPRRDSSVQTDGRAYDEVGVQTLNASTVDVPVQTCFGEWEEDDKYSYRRHAGAYRPRWPAAVYSSNQPFPSVLKPSQTALEYPTGTKNSIVAPLDSSKVLKYAAPHDSPASSETRVRDASVSGADKSQQAPDVITELSSERVPVKYFAAKELTSYNVYSPRPLSDSSNTGILSETVLKSKPAASNLTQDISLKPTSVQNVSTLKAVTLTPTTKFEDSSKKLTDRPEVSAELVIFSPPTDRPPSALKIERTDSPVKHSAKIKTVHFSLSDSDSVESVHKIDGEYTQPKEVHRNFEPDCKFDNPPIPEERNIDKDFEDLLRNLDILTGDTADFSDNSSNSNLKISFNSFPESPLKQTLFSSKLKSAFDVLHQDVLPPILENLNETLETDPQVLTNVNESITDKIEPENNSKINALPLDFIAESAVRFKVKKPPSPTLNIDENKLKGLEEDSRKSTSFTVVTSPKFDLDEGHSGNCENVYDSVIKENTLKSVTLPTLPFFFDSSPKCNKPELAVKAVCPSNSYTVSPHVLESDSEEKMLSRSNSRSSVRSNPKSESNTLLDTANRFDSCENLEQLEEEIIRSLCEPDTNSLDRNEIAKRFSPAVQRIKSPDATQMRRTILDRLISGEGTDTIVPGNRNVFTPDELIEVPEGEINTRQSQKHMATLTTFEHHRNETPPDSYLFSQQSNSYSRFNRPVISSDSPSVFDANPELDQNKKYSQNSDMSPVLMYPVKRETESPKKTSVFLFPENNLMNAGVPEHSSPGVSKTSGQGKILIESNLNYSAADKPVNAIHRDVAENDSIAGDPNSGKCDFSNCLRPSEVQNSPFINKIGSISIPLRCSPEKTYSRPTTPAIAESTESKFPNGVCDYANCLKPSQVQNSIFTAELSEITASKSGGECNRTNSPLTARTNTRMSMTASPTNTNKMEGKNIPKDEATPSDEVNHKSEVTIVLQPYRNKISQPETRAHDEDGIVKAPPVYSMKKEPSYLEQNSSVLPVQSASSSLTNTQTEEVQMNSEVPPPPPPPPPVLKPNDPAIKSIRNDGDSFESMIRKQHSNLTRTDIKSEQMYTSAKTPVVLELEKRFETHRRSSSEGRDQEVADQSKYSISDLPEVKSEISPVKNNGSISLLAQSSPNAITYQCNGSNGVSSPHREYNSPFHNGKNENGFNRREQVFSPKTIITDEPPPPGAVLLDKKITVDGDKVHTDKYYAIPVKEVLKETTTTTKFIPAPPKYEGIGPTEDGVPIAPRNSVKKENMHNWYKTMFKSLHKADSSNDGQEYIIGYSSEPETSRKEKTLRKKCSTLDNRSGNNNSVKTSDNLYKPSAKSSIEVYNVRPRLIEDFEPGHSSVTDDELTIGYKRYLPTLNTPKPSYEYKNGYEQDNNFIRNLSPEGPDPEQQKVWYKEIQKGGEIPQFGLGKPAPEKPKDPVIGPLPPPPLNYHGPTTSHPATRPLTLPANYQTDTGLCQQSNGPYEMQMRQAIHTELHHRISPSSSQLSSPSRSILKSPSRSPDLKIPARALFDFKTESSKEIPLKKGDLVLILRQLDKNWYEGERHGCIGIFPISYVEIVPPEHASTPIKTFTEGIGKVLYDFASHTSVELSVKKGDTVSLLRRIDSNWYEARFNNKKGIIPTSYLQVLQEPSEKSTLSPSPKSCMRSPRSSSETRDGFNIANLNSLSPTIIHNISSSSDSGRRKFQNRGKKTSSLIEPVMYKAIYSYSPQNGDELELFEGDTIYVVEMCDDGWYVGTSVRTGVFGIFPGNYVEKVW